MSDKVADSISRADLIEAKLLAGKGEEAVREAEESGDVIQVARAELARTFFLADEGSPLSTAQSRFEVLFQSSADALMTLEPPDWRFTSGNPTAIRMVGAKDEADFCRRAPWEYSPEFQPEGQPSKNKAREMIRVAMEKGSNYFEWTHRKIGGPDFPATVLLTRFVLNNRDILQATVRDISERKRVENELRNKKALLEAQLNSTPDGILIVDSSGKKIIQNQQTVDIWKIPRHVAEDPDDEQQLRHVMQMTTDPDQFAERVKHLYDHPNETTRDEVALKDGTVLDRYSAPVTGDKGDQFGRIWTFRDITERKKSELALTRAKEDLERVLNTVSVAIVQLNREGCITLLNRAGSELIECEPKEATGMDWIHNFVPEEDRAKTQEAFEILMRGEVEPVEYFENLVQTKAGCQKLVAWHNTVLSNEKGEIVGTLSSGEDITQRRQIEDQLRHSHKMEAIGQLSGGIAHDFNNLLSVILAQADLVRRELGERHPVSADMAEIQRASKKAAELVSQLLAFSKQQVLKPKILIIRESLNNLERMSKRAIPEDIKLSFTYDSNLDSIEVDPVQFERSLLNLLVNARDAMPDGGELSVTSSNRYMEETDIENFTNLQTGRHVQIVVRDTGMGIPPENLNRIFDPFFTTKGNRGTGLGLASVYGTVQQSGGDIGVESAVGEGTAFTLLFPSVKRASTPPPPSQRGPEIFKGEGNIVVVEDEEMLRKVQRKLLEKMGFRVIMFDGAKSILNFFEGKANEPLPFTSDKTDLIISDVKMPDMNGPKLIEELRKNNPDIKVLFVSGHSDETHGINSLEYPFMQKPYSYEELADTLKRLLPPKSKKS